MRAAMPLPTKIARLWRASYAVTSGAGARRLARRARYVHKALRHKAVALLLEPAHDSLLARTVAGRPDLLGLALAPYLHAQWDVDARIQRLARHVATLDTMGPNFAFGVHESVELLSLEAIAPGWHVVLDKPQWLHREGVLALNLFHDNTRWFSVAFAIEQEDGKRSVLVGGIQGRNLPGALDAYRELTRQAHGLRPRDLLIELLRMLTMAIEAESILAISDACRHHRNAFFGVKSRGPLPLDYDDIWRDRGGIPVEGGFFSLPVESQRRALEDIPAKKRGMYRKRYEMLDQLNRDLVAALRDKRPVTRPEAL